MHTSKRFKFFCHSQSIAQHKKFCVSENRAIVSQTCHSAHCHISNYLIYLLPPNKLLGKQFWTEFYLVGMIEKLYWYSVVFF